MLPSNPARQTQLIGTFCPELLVGQLTAEHVEEKNGKVVRATTLPLNPALQRQPFGTLVPRLFNGH